MKRILLFISLFVIFLLDAHLTDFIRTLFFTRLELRTYLFVIVFFYFCRRSHFFLALIAALFFGMIYDYYYLDFLGITALALPIATLLLLLVDKFVKNKRSKWQDFLLFTVFLSFFVGISFLLATNYHFTPISWSFFVTYHFLPALLLNLVIFIIFNKHCKQVFY